jgi:hypothetical protein
LSEDEKNKYVAGELDAARTRFTPNSNRESSNAAPAGREHEDLKYTCIGVIYFILMLAAYSIKFVKINKNYVPGVLDEKKTIFTPSSSRESSNAAPASREHEGSAYKCTLISEQHIL